MISQRHATKNDGLDSPESFRGWESLRECVRVAAGRVLNELHAALHKNEWRRERFHSL